MSTNEIRKDYLLNRWVIIAAGRRRRPTDFVGAGKRGEKGPCPFCPGNERMTPPATLVYLPSRRGIKKRKEREGTIHKNWVVRCFPNLYPALSPSAQALPGSEFTSRRAVGYHEILVESPRHDEHPSVARISQLVHAVHACLDRLQELSGRPHVKFVSIFRNHGMEAGASLSHAHMQLIATPMVPKLIQEELRASRGFWRRARGCAFCNILEKELRGPRLIGWNRSFVVFAPWASLNPFEFWIFPREHQPSPLAMGKTQVVDFARILRASLGGLRALLKDPPYNLGFHLAPVQGSFDYYHWHVEVYPRISIWAGFEKSTGMFINVVSPENAAEDLGKAVQRELEFI